MSPRVQMLSDVLLGHKSAIEFCLMLVDAAHVWDDLVDGDKPVAAADVHRAFESLLLDIPGNVFYQQNFAQLHPLLGNAVINWHAANTLESAGGALDLQIAFISRSSYCDVILKAIEIVGGRDHAKNVWPGVRRFVHGEGYEKYLTSLAAEKAARKET